MQRGLNVLALVKDSERYIFIYDNNSTTSVMQTLGCYAADRELSFTWYDAALLSQKVRKIKQSVDEAAEKEYEDWFGGEDLFDAAG